MRDRLVFGCKEESLREKFFKEEYEKLTFEKAVAICSVYQSARRQMAACGETEETVHAVAGKNTYRPTNVKSSFGSRKDDDSKPCTFKECDYCGRKHQWGRNRCPAFGKICTKCQGKNHFAVKCRTRKPVSGLTGRKNKVCMV